MSTDTHYEVLGVAPDADPEEIKSAYRRLSLQVHPDRGGSAALFRALTESYEVLSDPRRRAAYDARLRAPGWNGADEDADDWTTDNRATDDWPTDDWSADADGPSSAGDDAPPWGASTGGADPAPGADPGGPPWAAGAVSLGGGAPQGIWRTVDAHPAGTLIVLGVALVCFGRPVGGSSAAPLVLAGLVALALGLVAVVGSRRLAHRIRALGGEGDPIDVLPDAQFRRMVERAFVRNGFQVHPGAWSAWTGGPAGDLLVQRGRSRTVVQVSRSRAPVGPGAVLAAARTATERAAVGAIVLTNGTFTANAWEVARANRVVLWDRAALLSQLHEAGLVTDAGWVHPSGLVGGALLAAELRAGFPAVVRVVAIVIGILVAACALGGVGSGARARGRR